MNPNQKRGRPKIEGLKTKVTISVSVSRGTLEFLENFSNQLQISRSASVDTLVHSYLTSDTIAKAIANSKKEEG